MKTETLNTIKLILSVEDVKKLLPDEKFEYTMFWDYRDEIDVKTLEECMPNGSDYKNEDWVINYWAFAQNWKVNLEDKIWDWNIDYITDEINRDLTDKVQRALRYENFDYDELEFDFYPDELYSVDLDMDYILSRSRINWNVVWYNNFDWFTENETYEDDLAIKQIVDLFPDLVDKNDLERACADWMYTGSDLKVSFKSSMLDFLKAIESWEKDLTNTKAILHLWINWSWSPEFTLGKWVAHFSKQYWTTFDRRDWEIDWHYWIVDVYGWVFNDEY